MKSKKKMLLALGAMSAAAIGAGATSTFAWFTASAHAYASRGTETGTVSVSNNASASNLDISIGVAWPSIDPVNLTAGANVAADPGPARTLGTTYIVDQNGSVVPAADQNITKSKAVAFTFSSDISKMKKGVGYDQTVTPADLNAISTTKADIYTVKVKASGHIRIATSRTTSATGDANWVGEYTENALVTVGTVKITRGTGGTADTTGALNYAYVDPQLDTDSNPNNLEFFYSLSPLDNTSTGDYSGADSVNKRYGEISVVLVYQSTES